jgi:PDZ domain-containing protein
VNRRVTAASIAGSAVVLLTALLFFVHVPYAILSPGPVCNTVGAGNRDCPAVSGTSLIKITPVSADHPSGSRLGFTTVSVKNGEPSAAEALGAWLTSSEAVVPAEVITPPGKTQQQVDKVNRQDMQNAQDAAILAGEEAVFGVQVAKLQPGFPAAGVLRVGDVVLSVDGTPVYSAAGILAASASKDPARTFRLGIRRGGRVQQVTLGRKPSADGSGRLVFGVELGSVTSKAKVRITLDPSVIGGPSAGLMFSLGVYDRLTAGNITGNTVVAGTGTIDSSGQVGPIGGIQQKMYAAAHSFHAQVFLAPAGDCGDTKGSVPKGLRVVKVSTIDDALRALAGVRAGRTATLPAC